MEGWVIKTNYEEIEEKRVLWRDKCIITRLDKPNLKYKKEGIEYKSKTKTANYYPFLIIKGSYAYLFGQEYSGSIWRDCPTYVVDDFKKVVDEYKVMYNELTYIDGDGEEIFKPGFSAQDIVFDFERGEK